ncbi:hypothetical protein [Pseudarthrobacter sp. NPDC080039]|uniref:hypothetical protein n=1 Tax=unclassified Pseudarthrobacter TaxID=2647000 RepID=UPI00344C5EC5
MSDANGGNEEPPPNGKNTSAGNGSISKRIGWRPIFAAIVLISMIVAIVLGGVNLLGYLTKMPAGSPSEVTLTIWIILGVGVLLLMLMAIAVLSYLINGKGAQREALGLPEGSVSAVIALTLLLIFAIFTIYLYGQIRGVSQTDSCLRALQLTR